MSDACGAYNIIDGSCYNCVSGSPAVNGVCNVIADVNCQIPGVGRCQLCNPGYFIATDGVCIRIPQFCTTPDNSTGACSVCNPGYQLVAGVCRLPPQLLPEPAPTVPPTSSLSTATTTSTTATVDINCASSFGNTCFSCNKGFSLNNGQCVFVQNADSLCVNYVNFNCTACSANYVLENSRCNIQFCQQLSGQGTCAQCNSGYSLANQGFSCIQTPTISNCNTVSNGVCAICNSGYGLFNGGCALLPQNCVNLGSNGQCDSCISGYSLSQNGGFGSSQCIVIQTTTTAMLIPNCRESSPTGCIACSFQYWLTSNGSCQQVDTLCKTYNSANGFCTSCYESYVLSNSTGSCSLFVKNDTNCKTYNSALECTGCYEGFYLNSVKTCAIINPLCSRFNTTTG